MFAANVRNPAKDLPRPFSDDVRDVETRDDNRGEVAADVCEEQAEVGMHHVLRRRSDLHAELHRRLQWVDYREEEPSVLVTELHGRLYRELRVELLRHDDPVRDLDVAPGAQPERGEPVDPLHEELHLRILERDLDRPQDVVLVTEICKRKASMKRPYVIANNPSSV